jgi:hypothetical protein
VQTKSPDAETAPSTTSNACKSCPCRAPWWKILLEWLTFTAAVAAAIAAGIYAGVSQRMRKEMEVQTCIQRQLATASERAWVALAGPPQISGLTSLSNPRFNAYVKISLQNFGKGPALNVFVGLRFVAPERVEEAQTAVCNSVFPFIGLRPAGPVKPNDSDVSKTQWGLILYPSQPAFVQDINYGGESRTLLGQQAFLVGCIAYKDQFGSPHWAKFSYNTAPHASEAIRNPTSFHHLYVSLGNNYTDDVETRESCMVSKP